MKHTRGKSKDWEHSEEENKKLVRTIFGKMGGDKSKISVKKIEYAMEVKHQDFETTVIITRKDFDDKNIQAIERHLLIFLVV